VSGFLEGGVMIVRMVALWVCCGGFAAVQAGEIYKWKDANGKIHYGDSAQDANEGAKTIDLKNGALTEDRRQEAEARAAKQKALLQTNTTPAAPPPAPTAAPPATSVTRGKGNACEEAWRKYRESDACFAPYRLVNGGIKVEAFQHCVEVPQPPPCQ
jgi:hypothetical protein